MLDSVFNIFFPPQASTFAYRVDWLYWFLVILCTGVTLLIGVLVVYFGARYRKIPGEERESVNLEHPLLEVAWAAIPLVVVLGVFFWGAWLYADYMNVPEKGALELDVTAKRWMWKVQHPNGDIEVNDLHIPKGRPIVMRLTSQDVLHSYGIPAFRVKQDVIPGRFQKLWFEPTKTGTYHIFCMEYCGTEHSMMKGTVTVLEPHEYAEWLEGGLGKSPLEMGEFLFNRFGCFDCHNSLPDARGPDLAGVYGSTGRLVDGTEVEKDENYLRDAILDSGRQVVEGYTALMPSFSQKLTDDEVRYLITYVKSLVPEDRTD